MIYVVLWLFLSLAAGFLGKNRAAGFWGCFIGSIFFSPVLVLLILAVTQPSHPARLDGAAK